MREAAVIGVGHVNCRAAGLRRRARDTGVLRGAAAGREAGGESRACDFEICAHAAERVVVLFAVDGARTAVGLAAAVAEVDLVVRAGVAVDGSRDYLRSREVSMDSSWDLVQVAESLAVSRLSCFLWRQRQRQRWCCLLSVSTRLDVSTSGSLQR